MEQLRFVKINIILTIIVLFLVIFLIISNNNVNNSNKENLRFPENIKKETMNNNSQTFDSDNISSNMNEENNLFGGAILDSSGGLGGSGSSGGSGKVNGNNIPVNQVHDCEARGGTCYPLSEETPNCLYYDEDLILHSDVPCLIPGTDDINLSKICCIIRD